MQGFLAVRSRECSQQVLPVTIWLFTTPHPKNNTPPASYIASQYQRFAYVCPPPLPKKIFRLSDDIYFAAFSYLSGYRGRRKSHILIMHTRVILFTVLSLHDGRGYKFIILAFDSRSHAHIGPVWANSSVSGDALVDTTWEDLSSWAHEN